MGKNTITIFGTAGREGELRTTNTGREVYSFGVATNPKADETQWFNVTIWGKRALWASRYIKKGEKVFVSGALTLEVYRATSGDHRVSADIDAREVDIAWTKHQDTATIDRKPTPPTTRHDDVPF